LPRVFPQIGESPLYDAIYTGIDAMKEAANPRQMLLVIAAGFDNGRGVTDDQLTNFAIKQPVEVYSIQLGGTPVVANLLDLLSGVTGGRANLSSASSFQLEAMCNEMALAVKSQYLIGYKSTNTETNGHRRGVKVKVSSAGRIFQAHRVDKIRLLRAQGAQNKIKRGRWEMNRLKFRTIAVFAATVLALTIAPHAQFQNQRGIDPRNPQAGLPGAAQPAAPAASNEPPPLETDLVLLTVSVSAGDNRALPALARESFEVFEDGVSQKISYFWQDSRPISVGLLIDDSDFMGKNQKYDAVRDVLPTFLKGKNSQDEYFVVQFSTFPRMTVSYTTDAKQAVILFPAGKEDATPDTALSDAIYLGLEAIKESANSRKALLVITAGGDKGCDDATVNTAMGRPIPTDQLVSFAIKQPVQIYSMMIADDWGTANAGSPCNQIPKDENTLDELAGATGGHAYLASNSQGGVNSIATEVARALKTQFLIGYKSTNTAKDGHRRGVKVKVNPPEGSPKLKVWTKSGYYAPKVKS
jgi:Ca-activated chloride channel family protein